MQNSEEILSFVAPVAPYMLRSLAMRVMLLELFFPDEAHVYVLLRLSPVSMRYPRSLKLARPNRTAAVFDFATLNHNPSRQIQFPMILSEIKQEFAFSTFQMFYFPFMNSVLFD